MLEYQLGPSCLYLEIYKANEQYKIQSTVFISLREIAGQQQIFFLKHDNKYKIVITVLSCLMTNINPLICITASSLPPLHTDELVS